MLRKPRSRRLLVLMLALLALAAGGAVLVHRALAGGTLRAAAEARLSALLGQPVRIGAISARLFPRPTVAGTSIVVGSGAAAPGIEIERITILPVLRSLWRGPAIVEEVRLEGFVVSVLRDEAGGWHVPAAVPAPTGGGPQSLVVRSVSVTNGRIRVFDTVEGRPRQTAHIRDLSADAIATGDGLRLAPIAGRIGNAEMRGEAAAGPAEATLQFEASGISEGDLPAVLGLLGTAKPAFLRLPSPASADVALAIDRRTSRLSARGTLRAAGVGVEPLLLEQVDAPFTLDDLRLVSRPAAFRLYGGSHTGSVSVDLRGAAPRWAVDSRLTGVDLGRFLDTLTGTDARLDGTASVAGALHGLLNASLAETVTGRVRLTVADGVIRQFPLLAAINRAARLTGGDATDTRFERLTATLALGGGWAITEDLLLAAGQVRVEAAGAIGFDRTLALRGKAILSPERAAAAMQSVRELSGLRNERGELEIPLTVAGTLDAPSINVDVRAVVGKGIRDELKRRLDRFLRR